MISGNKADKMILISHIILLIGVIISLYNFILITINPISNIINPKALVFFILLTLGVLYSSQLGNYFNKPSIKIVQYIWLVTALSIFSLSYLSITFNTIFINVLQKIKNIDVIPQDMLIGNIRVITSILPTAIILPVLYISLITLKDKKSKERIREFEFTSLLPTFHKSDDTTIDIEIGKDFKTGLPLVVPEKIMYEHTWLQGGSGSGKSSNYVIPVEEQLLKKKSYLNYNLKKIAIECLESNIAYLTKPVTNEEFNENFNFNLIAPIPGKEEVFNKAFDKYSLGIIENDKVVIEKKFEGTNIDIIDGLKSKDYIYSCSVYTKQQGKIINKMDFTIEKNMENQTHENQFVKVVTRNMELPQNENNKDLNYTTGYKLIEGTNEIAIEVQAKNNSNNLSLELNVYLKGNGRLVPKNLGLTVVAPDGELINTTVNMAKEYGIKVHKIDPDMNEIRKGKIAKFNPLRGDSPEKIGDIVASVLVSMDAGDSSKSNPYFTNASVRAVRNLVILLKVTYPKKRNREPTLEDVLYYLNNMNSVIELFDVFDYNQLQMYSTVIDYFYVNFIDKKEKSKNNIEQTTDFIPERLYSSETGSQKRETQRALGGIINQLDNLLAREEIRYILCNDSDSIDLSDVLRDGECIAISTRQGNLGARLGKAFALFFILSLQNEVLSRYAENENPEIPHFLIIDEFPMYCNESTETFFSFARKYKCSVTIAIQNMGQLKKVSDEFGETIFTNTSTKILMSKSNLEDRKYWSDYFGTITDMEYMTGISTSSIFADNPTYTEQIRGTVSELKVVTEEAVDNLKFQEMLYSYINHKARKSIGKGTTSFVEIKPEPYMREIFDFEKYSIKEEEYVKIKKKRKERVFNEINIKLQDKGKKEHLLYENGEQTKNSPDIKEETIDNKFLSVDVNNLQLLLPEKEEKTDKTIKEEKTIQNKNDKIILNKQEHKESQNSNSKTFKTIDMD